MRYSTGLKGDVSEETTQSWQRVMGEAELSEIFDHVEVGRIDQSDKRVAIGQKPYR